MRTDQGCMTISHGPVHRPAKPGIEDVGGRAHSDRRLVPCQAQGLCPDRRRGQFHTVAGRVPQVERTPSSRPALVPLDGDPALLQAATPGLERSFLDGKGHVPRAHCPMRRDGLALTRGPRPKQEKEASPTVEEGMPAGFSPNERQSKLVGVEALGRLQIVGIQTGLEHALQAHIGRRGGNAHRLYNRSAGR